MISRLIPAFFGADKTRLSVGMPSITTLPINGIPPWVRVRWRWDNVGVAFVKTAGQIAKHILVMDGEDALRILQPPEAVNKTLLTP